MSDKEDRMPWGPGGGTTMRSEACPTQEAVWGHLQVDLEETQMYTEEPMK